MTDKGDLCVEGLRCTRTVYDIAMARRMGVNFTVFSVVIIIVTIIVVPINVLFYIIKINRVNIISDETVACYDNRYKLQRAKL